MISWKKPSVKRDLVAPFEASSDKKEFLQAYGTHVGRSSVRAYGQTWDYFSLKVKALYLTQNRNRKCLEHYNKRKNQLISSLSVNDLHSQAYCHWHGCSDGRCFGRTYVNFSVVSISSMSPICICTFYNRLELHSSIIFWIIEFTAAVDIYDIYQWTCIKVVAKKYLPLAD